jgi:hypothetical protein
MDPKAQVWKRIRGEAGKRELSEDDLIEIHHRMNVVYGWIPIAEFSKIPLPALWNLLPRINEEYKERKEIYQAIMALVGVKPEKRRRRK